MSRQKTGAFLVDCLSSMPDQPEQVQRVVDTAIAGLTRIADGGEWPESEVWAADWAANWPVSAVHAGLDWAAAFAAEWATEWATVRAAEAADRAAEWAARAHPDPDAERARQAKVREKLGLNTKQEAD
jgi:hypothetical protein